MITFLIVLGSVFVYSLIGYMIGIYQDHYGIITKDEAIYPLNVLAWPIFLFCYTVRYVGRILARLIFKF